MKQVFLKFIIWILFTHSWVTLANSDLWNFPFSSSTIEKIGYYSGSFDPIQIGHRNTIEAAIKDLGLTKVYVTVNAMTNKEYKSSIAQRVRMVKAMLIEYLGDVEVIVSVEPIFGRKWLAQQLVQRHGSNNVHAIFGTDVFQKNYDLLESVPGLRISLLGREGYEIDTSHFDQSRIDVIHVPGEFSSTQVRKDLIETGRSSLITDEINDIIRRRALYPSSNYYKEVDYLVSKRQFILYRLKQRFLDLNLPVEPIIPIPQQTEDAYNDLIIRQVLNSNRYPIAKKEEVYRYFQSLISSDELIFYQSLQARSILYKSAFIFESSESSNSSDFEVIRKVRELIRQNGMERVHLVVDSKRDMTTLRSAMSDLGDKVIVLPEPIEGADKYFHLLNATYAGDVYHFAPNGVTTSIPKEVSKLKLRNIRPTPTPIKSWSISDISTFMKIKSRRTRTTPCSVRLIQIKAKH